MLKIYKPLKNNNKLILRHEILYCEADVNYSIIHAKDTKFISGYNIKRLSKRFDLLKVNRSIIVNPDKAVYEGDSVIINNEKFIFSRRKLQSWQKQQRE